MLLPSIFVKKVKVSGFSRTKFHSVKSKFTKNTMNAQIEVTIPEIVLEGVYKGEFANLPFLRPSGFFNMTACELFK